MSAKQRVIGIVGPTAGGKTDLSLALASVLSIEILCMDSMQVFRGMDIGTAKPTPHERALVPHHLLDLRQPEESFSVAEYAALAREAISGIAASGKLPVLVGGTGLYLRALSLPLSLGGVPKDDAIRARYKALLEEEGAQALHDALMQVDVVTARRLHPNDTRRVIRALEVHAATGLPFSAQEMPSYDDSPYDLLLYALDWPRETLYDRIDQRADQMMRQGLLGEVEGLHKRGLSPQAQSMQGLGYKELLSYLMGEGDLKQGMELIKRRTRNYAKRQLTWFRADPRVKWLSAGMDADGFVDLVRQDVRRSED